MKINADCALHVSAGQEILNGLLPFRDLYDTNPPMIMYVNATALWLLGPFRFPPILAWNLFVYSLSLYSVIATAGMLLIMTRLSGSPKRSIDDVFLLILLYSTSLIYIFVESYNFGQREHLFFLCYLPFFCLRTNRWMGNPLPRLYSIPPVLLFAITCCFKHYFLILALLPEIYWLFSKRKLRFLVPMDWALAACVVVAYLACLLFLNPETADGFLNHWLPLVSAGYDTYNSNYHLLITRLSGIWIPTAGIAIAAILIKPRKTISLWSLVPPMGIFTLGGVLLFFWQGKGWIYHLIPAMFGAYIIVSIALINLVSSYEVHKVLLRVRFIFVLSMIGLIFTLLPVRLPSYYPLFWPGTFFFYGLCSVVLISFIGNPQRLAKTRSPTSIILLAFPLFSILLWVYGFGPDVGFKYAAAFLLITIVMLHQVLPISQRTTIRITASPEIFSTIICFVALIPLDYSLFDVSRKPAFNGSQSHLGSVIERYSQSRSPVLVISSGVIPAFPLLTIMNRPPGSRYLVHFPIPCIYSSSIKDDTPESRFGFNPDPALLEQETKYLRNLKTDIIERRPGIIAIKNDIKCQGCPNGFNIYEYLSFKGLVRAISEDGYQYVGPSMGCKVYARLGQSESIDAKILEASTRVSP